MSDVNQENSPQPEGRAQGGGDGGGGSAGPSSVKVNPEVKPTPEVKPPEKKPPEAKEPEGESLDARSPEEVKPPERKTAEEERAGEKQEPEAKSEAGKEKKRTLDPAFGQANSFGKVKAGKMKFVQAEQINHITQHISTERVSVRHFSASDGVEVTETHEQECVRRFRGSDGELEELLVHLTEKRILVLSADRGARKASVATCLGWHLRDRGGCKRPTLRVEGLRTHTRIDLLQLAQKDPELDGRVAIFRSPFATGNPDLLGVFEKMDRAGWEQVAARLRDRGAYLVFTATPDEVEPFRERVRDLRREVAPHPPAVLAEVLDGRLAEAESGGTAAPEALALLRAHRERLLGTFPYAARLAEFVDFWLGIDPPPLLDEALRRFNDSSRFLLSEVDGDFDAWSFGFTLALAHCARDTNGVRWVDFDRLHGYVRQWLRRDLAQRKAADEEDDGRPDLRLELSDEALQKRCRAEVRKDPDTLADQIHFRDGGSEALWTVMLGRHRRVLGALLPRLRELVERLGDGEDDRALRAMAAQIIGRIGEIDPQRLVLPLVTRWVDVAVTTRRSAVGPLFQGVMASTSERYRSVCLAHLHGMRPTPPPAASPPDPQPGEGGVGASLSALRSGPAVPVNSSAARSADARLSTIIGTYTWVGRYDLPLAMRELCAISAAHLVPVVDRAQPMVRELGVIAATLQQQVALAEAEAPSPLARELSDAEVDHLVGRFQALGSELDAVLSPCELTLGSVQVALLSLCRTAGPIPVFREMRSWITEGGWKQALLLALMLFHDEGIAETLAGERVDLPATDGRRALRSSVLVEAIASGDDAVRQTVRLMGDLYESISLLFKVHGPLQRFCVETLAEHLTRWVQDALPVPGHRAAMKRLFELLARTHDGILRAPLLRVLNGPAFARGKPEMRDFAASLDLAGERPPPAAPLLTA
ncbi:MAG: hypothetical protein JO306_03515 [Gemmatimonadetes bacterium]|nr:hypothetical protein [Gemmatimonadota bacterium]